MKQRNKAHNTSFRRAANSAAPVNSALVYKGKNTMRGYVLLTLIFFSAYAVSEEECIFNPDAFNESWIKDRPALKNYDWFPDRREFTVSLNENETLSISGGGCAHYGESYKLIIKHDKEILRDSEWYKNKLLKLAELTLKENKFKEFQNELSEMEIPVLSISSGKEFRLDSVAWEDYGLSISDKASVMEFEINWYIN